MCWRPRFFSSLSSLFVGMLAFLLPVNPLRAQGNDNILPADGTDGIRKEFVTYRSVVPGLFKGEISIRSNEQRNLAAIDFEARWTMYRFTWRSEYHNEEGKLDRLFKEFESDRSNLLKKKGDQDAQAVLEQFAKQLVVHGKEVLQTNQQIARVNAVRVLEKMADGTGAGQNELAEVFTEILNDSKETNDGVKLYALRGLRNLLAYPKPKQPLLTREREEKGIQAIVDFVERKVDFAAAVPRDELEGYRSLRREGFRALAWSRYPSLSEKGRPGLVLLRAAVRDGFKPEVRVDEQFEAALGVTRLQPQLDPSYQKDYAIYILGQFIVELGSHYQADKEKAKEKRPYKVYAVRLLEGLEQMKADSKNKPVDAYTRAAAAECAKVLTKLETEGTPVPFDLATWLDKNAPPNKQLYRGGPDSTVKPAGRRDAAEAVTGG